MNKKFKKIFNLVLIICMLLWIASNMKAADQEQCAKNKQQCYNNKKTEIERIRKLCEKEIKASTIKASGEAIAAAIAVILSDGLATPILAIIGAERLHESAIAEIDVIRERAQNNIDKALQECRLNERCN